MQKLEVVNGKWVRVNLVDGSGENTVPYFSIGSVETFERNLENAQMELGMDAAHSIPVFYKQEIEASNVISALPTLLLIAFLFWSFRRASGAMGGMGGGKNIEIRNDNTFFKLGRQTLVPKNPKWVQISD